MHAANNTTCDRVDSVRQNFCSVKVLCMRLHQWNHHNRFIRVASFVIGRLRVGCCMEKLSDVHHVQCIGTVIQLIYHSSPEMLTESLREVPFSSFLVGLLSSSSAETAAPGMVLAELLMHKLPTIYRSLFVKEGTCHALSQLAALALPPKPAVLQAWHFLTECLELTIVVPATFFYPGSYLRVQIQHMLWESLAFALYL